MPKVFFSYSHRDEAARDTLEVHLSQLKREGSIESWHDRRILAGTELHGEISQQLEEADIVLLLVSPYFLASNYCNDVEVKRAMERHDANEARVIPVILDPCDWHSAIFGRLMAVPTDGKPISKFTNMHDGFLEVAKAIRALLPAPAKTPPRAASAAPSPGRPTPVSTPAPRSSNLGVKKVFNDHDRDAFLDDAFAYLARFFENSLKELQERNPGITTRFRAASNERFAAYIYRNGQTISTCSVRMHDTLRGMIAYSSDPDTTNSFNETLAVGDNGTTQFLKAGGTNPFGRHAGSELTPQGAAEAFWGMLMEPLQR